MIGSDSSSHPYLPRQLTSSLLEITPDLSKARSHRRHPNPSSLLHMYVEYIE